MTTIYEPIDRNRWFKDRDGVLTTSKHRDEVLKVRIDWTDALTESGETVSTSTWQNAQGVTASSAALATPVATVTITGTDGSIENKVVTSASRTLIRLIRFVGVPEGGDRSDYRE